MTSTKKAIQFSSILLVILLISNLILYPFGKVPGWLFWIIIAICAVYAYLILPKLK